MIKGSNYRLLNRYVYLTVQTLKLKHIPASEENIILGKIISRRYMTSSDKLVLATFVPNFDVTNTAKAFMFERQWSLLSNVHAMVFVLHYSYCLCLSP